MAKASDMIKHVFVLMLENRSFDHMLGQSGIAGLAPVGKFNNDPKNGQNITAGPFPGDPVYQLNKNYADPAHELENTFRQLTGLDMNTNYVKGDAYPNDKINNSGFVADYYINAKSGQEDTVMYGFNDTQVPVINALAREFAVCDCWFSSLPGPTVPNRLFVHAATSGGLDDSPNPLTLVWQMAFKGVQFQNGSIYDRINGTSPGPQPVTWHVYKDGNFALVEQISGIKKRSAQVHSLDDMKEMLNGYGDAPTYNFIEPRYELIGNYKNGNSQHPYGDVRAGEKLIKEVYETIVASPVWEQSLLVILYDEHGGFYDHVAPPAAVPPGDNIPAGIKSKYGFRFDQYGVRVPALFISPFIPKGTVIKAQPDSQFDHSSIVRTLCDLWGLGPLTDRDRSARSILPELLLDTAPRTDAITTLPDPNVPADILTALAQPPADTPSDFSDDDNAAPLDGVAYSYAHIAIMDKVKDMSDEDATATIAQLSDNINTKGDAMNFISDAITDMNDTSNMA